MTHPVPPFSNTCEALRQETRTESSGNSSSSGGGERGGGVGGGAFGEVAVSERC